MSNNNTKKLLQGYLKYNVDEKLLDFVAENAPTVLFSSMEHICRKAGVSEVAFCAFLAAFGAAVFSFATGFSALLTFLGSFFAAFFVSFLSSFWGSWAALLCAFAGAAFLPAGRRTLGRFLPVFSLVSLVLLFRVFSLSVTMISFLLFQRHEFAPYWSGTGAAADSAILFFSQGEWFVLRKNP